jgi:hypothetical protein
LAPSFDITEFNVDSGCLGSDERGAVWPIFPASSFPGDGRVRGDEEALAIPAAEVRSALLFFDKFDVPEQNQLAGVTWCAEEFRRIGVLSSSRAVTHGDIATILRDLPFEVFERRDRLDPGMWTLARPALAFGFPADRLQPGTAVAITLHQALPTFTRNVDLEDVLDFKRRAWPELLALRQHLNDLGREIGHNGVNGVEETSAYRDFEAALKDHIRMMGESNREKIWQSFKASFDLPTLTGPGLEYAFSGTLNLATVGAGAAGIGIQTVAGLMKKTKGPSPFEYLTSANLEL